MKLASLLPVLALGAVVLLACPTTTPEMPAAEPPPAPGPQTPLAEIGEWFLAGGEGYRAKAVEELEAAIEAVLAPPDPDSVFLASGRLGPLVKAVLALEVADGVLPRARYRLLYGLEWVEAPPAADPVPVSFVQVDRFNLGPALRDELAAIHGADRVGPPEAFGVGPHVSWRLVTRPIVGQAADVVAAGRAELSAATAHDMECLGASCLSTAGEVAAAVPWDELEPVAGERDVVYERERDGLPTPAAVIGLLAADLALEPRESLAFGEPFAEAVIELNLGQDSGLDAAVRDGELMDDSVAAAWRRLVAVGAGPGAPPRFFTASAFECRRGPELAPPGELCP